jgi:hypothetical protein
MQHSGLLGTAGGVREGNTFFFNVRSVSLTLGKIDRYFNLLARRETVGLDVDQDGVVASLLDGSDLAEGHE